MSPPSMTEESIRNLIDDKMTPIAVDVGRLADSSERLEKRFDDMEKKLDSHVLKEDTREDLRAKNRDTFFKVATVMLPTLVIVGSTVGYLLTHLKP